MPARKKTRRRRRRKTQKGGFVLPYLKAFARLVHKDRRLHKAKLRRYHKVSKRVLGTGMKSHRHVNKKVMSTLYSLFIMPARKKTRRRRRRKTQKGGFILPYLMAFGGQAYKDRKLLKARLRQRKKMFKRTLGGRHVR